mmetsp:Transcript_13801/g.42769  ORF Transcript_13801/g.42769 Transcript_13801/m.42769 type:complete len:81 (-) Transcript_13801:1210-1452(-)
MEQSETHVIVQGADKAATQSQMVPQVSRIPLGADLVHPFLQKELAWKAIHQKYIPPTTDQQNGHSPGNLEELQEVDSDQR